MEGCNLCFCTKISTFSLTSSIDVTNLVKLKTDTLLPTGDSSELPSGVKTRLPCPYTVPRRFENCGTVN